MWETQIRFLGWEDPLENGMATHSSILAWRIPWTEAPGGLQSMGLQRGRHSHTQHTRLRLPRCTVGGKRISSDHHYGQFHVFQGSHLCSTKPRLFVGAPKVLSYLVPTSSGLVSSSDHLPYRYGSPDGLTSPHLHAPSSRLSWQLISQLHMVPTFPGNAPLNQPFSKWGLGAPTRGSMKSKLFL